MQSSDSILRSSRIGLALPQQILGSRALGWTREASVMRTNETLDLQLDLLWLAVAGLLIVLGAGVLSRSPWGRVLESDKVGPMGRVEWTIDGQVHSGLVPPSSPTFVAVPSSADSCLENRIDHSHP